ncbi:hypothetical protein [Xanthomonas maliensis]|uniref:hypothetical protein n=1 Tax=Xanthomonas maliensis TaxID=1321368 RepID=UPI0003A559F2|nr:hypothetical protein [Xanthomonas maliensis]KAB7769165.1 hypothetical protein CKY51_07965 [Xanthomonas maliensis]
MRRRALGLLLCGLVGASQATEQIPDRIQLDGQDAVVLAEPLSSVLDDPATWQRFVAHAGSALGACSANWRGYQAFWRVDGNRLLLDRVVLGACADAPPTLPLPVLFPNRRAPVVADWVDGEVLVALPDPPAPGTPASALPYVLLQLRHGQVIRREPLTPAQLAARRAAPDASP